jgi:hypothetical protein
VNFVPAQASIRISLLTLLSLSAGLVAGRADVVQPTVILPPPDGEYTFSAICFASFRCVESPVVSDFVITSETEVSGNEVVTVDATYTSDIYTNSSGHPGIFLGALSMSGTMDITYFGRNPFVNPLGTFSSQITSFDFSGSLHGNTLAVIQNPSVASTGTTTIVPVAPFNPLSPLYDVTSSFNINGEYSFNGGPFVTAPTRTGTLTSIPEPGSGTLAALILTVVLGVASRRRQIGRSRLEA